MNRLVIIGNGFDLAHGLKTSYKDFIEWYWNNKVKKFIKEPHFNSSEHSDPLCSLKASKDINSIQFFNFCNSNLFFYQRKDSYTYQEVKKYFDDNSKYLLMESSPFLERIMNNLNEKGWAGIEFDYYQLLKETLEPECEFTANELNSQLQFLQTKLVEYLKTLDKASLQQSLFDKITNKIDTSDFSVKSEDIAIKGISDEEISGIITDHTGPRCLNKTIPYNTMILSFNYTNTALLYNTKNKKIAPFDINPPKETFIEHNYIHGSLDTPEQIIFGYGDDLERNYKDILDTNDNEMLKYSKSVKYLETNNYHRLLQFIESAPFQVFIMGHSCGISDRTLLNTIFEHDNCVSIKPFYHEDKDKGTDNFLDIVMNLSRNFNDKQKFRDRVVNKERCETI